MWALIWAGVCFCVCKCHSTRMARNVKCDQVHTQTRIVERMLEAGCLIFRHKNSRHKRFSIMFMTTQLRWTGPNANLSKCTNQLRVVPQRRGGDVPAHMCRSVNKSVVTTIALARLKSYAYRSLGPLPMSCLLLTPTLIPPHSHLESDLYRKFNANDHNAVFCVCNFVCFFFNDQYNIKYEENHLFSLSIQ